MECPYNGYYENRSFNIILYPLIIGAISVFLCAIPSSIFAIDFVNHTSDRYKIEFQYPHNWTVEEKTSRFDESADIQIESGNMIDNGLITIVYADNLIEGFGSTDLRTSVYTAFKESITGDYSKEYRVIEKPSFIVIDNLDTGTFLFTSKDKYEDYAIKWARQYWITFNNDKGYLIAYTSSADTFDNPENIEIRDKFINSIRFID